MERQEGQRNADLLRKRIIVRKNDRWTDISRKGEGRKGREKGGQTESIKYLD